MMKPKTKKKRNRRHDEISSSSSSGAMQKRKKSKMPKESRLEKIGKCFKKASAADQKMIKGLRVSFCDVAGRDMQKGTVELYLRKFDMFGIMAYRGWKEGTTHVVASTHVSEEVMKRYVGNKKSLEGIKIVSNGWAQAIIQKKIPNESLDQEYNWFLLQRKTLKRKSTDLLKNKKKEKKKGFQLSTNDSDDSDEDSDDDDDDDAVDEDDGHFPGKEGDNYLDLNLNDNTGKLSSNQVHYLSWMRKIPAEYKSAVQKYIKLEQSAGIKLPKTIRGLIPNEGTSIPFRAYNPKQSYMAFRSGSHLMKENLNEHITKHLQVMKEYYAVRGTDSQWNEKSYQKAIEFLKNLDFKLTDIKQLPERRGFGQKMIDHVDEILRTGKFSKAIQVTQTAEYKAIAELTKVHGIANATAYKLYKKKGIRNLVDLSEYHRKKPVELNLTKPQVIGLRYVEDFQHKMPREEAEQIGQVVKATIDEIWPKKGVFSEVVGSFRRGAHKCGDVDMILTTAGLAGCPPLPDLIDALTENGLLIDHLTDYRKNASKEQNGYGQVKEKQSYMGVCRLPPDPSRPNEPRLARRIDIKIYPIHMFPFALIYFTGNDHFNRSLRYYCRVNNMSLSDEGLFKIVRVGKEKLVTGPRILECSSEQEIFEHLGFPYKTPEERNCADSRVDDAIHDKKWLGKPELLEKAIQKDHYLD